MRIMNIFMLTMFIQLIFTINSEYVKSDGLKIFSTSPIGPYKLIFKQTYSVNLAKNNTIQCNYYLSHRDNKTFIFGNTTLNIPFDDTLFLELKMALKDSSGRWKENLYMQKWPNACSSLKKIIGNTWTAFVYGLGINHTNCPLPTGFHTGRGLDTSLFKYSNLPKTFLYGTYKVYFYFLQKNEIVGGQVYILEFKRP
ncbi:uncharacterized protein LOC132917818 [Rhopalosiphum padi]|uniref:uncharacterized protein LOC132917818 n=1 Tax=Rhopalosiphum padi TaxID=40932 RepID=UPI00298ECE8C|nr:uncharacterized protein LOC132917818 [Rhopalosiphum padi]